MSLSNLITRTFCERSMPSIRLKGRLISIPLTIITLLKYSIKKDVDNILDVRMMMRESEIKITLLFLILLIVYIIVIILPVTF